MYYQVIAFILLFPWLLLGVTIVGSLRIRRTRKVRFISGTSPLQPGALAPPSRQSAPRS